MSFPTISFSDLKALAEEINVFNIGVIDLDENPDVDSWYQQRFDRWIEEGRHADMEYLTRYEDVRRTPKALLPEAHSLIIIALSYAPLQKQAASAPKITKYALGRDYHKVLKKRIEALAEKLSQRFPHTYRSVTDTAPIPERYWAARAGVGQIGKNTCLIVPGMGSWCVIGSLLTSVRVTDLPRKEALSFPDTGADICLECDRCVRACPTGALSPFSLDARKCINYWTIENRSEEIPEEINSKMASRLVGCDTCLDVCPYNKNVPPTTESELLPKESLLDLSPEMLSKMEEKEYGDMFFGTSLTRTKWSGMKRNIRYFIQRKNKKK